MLGIELEMEGFCLNEKFEVRRFGNHLFFVMSTGSTFFTTGSYFSYFFTGWFFTGSDFSIAGSKFSYFAIGLPCLSVVSFRLPVVMSTGTNSEF